MDDLLGEDWQSAPKQPALQPHNPTIIASGSSSLQASNSSTPFSALSLSRPASTAPAGQAKSPFNAPKPSTDVFGSLTGLKTQQKESLSIQEKQKRLVEERQRQLQEQAKQWDSLGSKTQSNGSKPLDDEDDILAAFNKDAKVDKSSHFPPPVSGQDTPANGTQQHSYGDFEDDDTFGLSGLAQKSNGYDATSEHNDDILGDLSRPVTTKSVSARDSRSDSPDEDWNENVANARAHVSQDPSLSELVEMGFPKDTAQIALSENGGDVQRAVGWLLQQAHEESKQKAKEQISGRQSPVRAGRSSPPRARRGEAAVPSWVKQDSRSSSNSRHEHPSQPGSEKETSQIAQDLGSKLFKSANSLWKASQKQMAKTVAEFQQERDEGQPKWMQSGSSSRDGSQPRPQRHVQPKNLTDEAALLDMPRDGPPVRSLKSSLPQEQPSSTNGRSPVTSQQASARASPQPFQDRRPASKLSRQDVEEQSAQAYVSPARRKQAKPKPEVVRAPEPEVDLFSPAPSQPTQPTPAKARSATASLPKPHVHARSIPSVSSTSLATSAQHRKLGTEAFKRGDYSAAYDAYTSALQPLPTTHPLVIVVLSNRSLTALKTGDAKITVTDADRALDIIGASLGVGETIDFGAEGVKDMREFYGKALMRKAEALEHMERWTEAANVWRVAVEGGVGGAVSLRGKDRCEKAATPASARPKVVTSTVRPKPAPTRSLGNSLIRPTLTTPSSDAAVKKLREANAAAERADDEKFQLADKVEAQLVAWKGSKSDNLRALLQSLDAVLWESAGWKKVGMSDLVMPNKVKIIYMKAIAKVHPDKIGQDASTEQRMISAAVFSTLNEAWDKFKKDNNL